MNTPSYSPFVKTKRGESKALKELDSRVKHSIVPFFDVLALSRGVTSESDVHKHLEKQVSMVELAWADQNICYVDLYDVNPAARALDGVHPLTLINALLEKKKISYVPVAGLARDLNYLVALRSVVNDGGSALALRLEVEDLLLPSNLKVKILTLVSELGAVNLPLHILIDCRSLVGQDVRKLKNAIQTALPVIRSLSPVRITLAASSMEANVSGFKKNTINRIKRDDLALWIDVCQAGAWDVGFGDYGVIHPDYVDLDPTVIKPTAKIRYTTGSEWIFVKGFRWIDDTSQHHHLSKQLAACSEFRGDDSWGGHYIESAAVGRSKYGTLETWVTVDQNSHITLTSKQVERILMTARQVATRTPKIHI